MGKKIDLARYKKALDFSTTTTKIEIERNKTSLLNYLSSVSNLIIESNGTTDEAISVLFMIILNLRVYLEKVFDKKNLE